MHNIYIYIYICIQGGNNRGNAAVVGGANRQIGLNNKQRVACGEILTALEALASSKVRACAHMSRSGSCLYIRLSFRLPFLFSSIFFSLSSPLPLPSHSSLFPLSHLSSPHFPLSLSTSPLSPHLSTPLITSSHLSTPLVTYPHLSILLPHLSIHLSVHDSLGDGLYFSIL